MFLILLALRLYSFILLARVLMTWLPNLDYHNPIVQFLLRSTEPVLKPIREMLPPTQGIDFSPIIVFIGINILSQILVGMF